MNATLLNTFVFIALTCFASCQSNLQQRSEVLDTIVKDTPSDKAANIVEVDEVKPFTDFMPFWEYYSYKIKLNEDFIAYDYNHNRISKLQFLKTLATGKYQPILINPADSIRYKLKTSPVAAPPEISTYLKMFAEQEITFYGMERKAAPQFNFTTLGGEKYNSENTKGKIVLLKCWFISCVPCVKEMPELNELVNSYRDREDILFISLALDKPAALQAFLKKTKFDYQTVGSQGEYISKQLHINAFPTHVLIDQEGKVVKMTNSAAQLKTFLNRIDPAQNKL